MKLAAALFLLLSSCLAAFPALPQVGIASFYSDEFKGKLMANGRPFNPDELTCAIWGVQFGTRLRVTNISNGKSVVCVVTDRGPAKRLNRIIDLSRASFQSIANLDDGLCTVQIERIK